MAIRSGRWWLPGVAVCAVLCASSGVAWAKFQGRSLLIERIETATERTLNAEELRAFADAAEAFTGRFAAERDRLAQTIADDLDLPQQVIEATLFPVGTIREDIEPRVFAALRGALNRPVSSDERHLIEEAYRQYWREFRRLRISYWEEMAKLSGLSFNRVKELLPEIVS